MSNSMVSTVLEIEREAESVLAKAERDAAAAVAGAREQRATAGKTAEENVKNEIADLEAAAKADREVKVHELTAKGDTSLSAVRNISDAAFANGVQYIMDGLFGK